MPNYMIRIQLTDPSSGSDYARLHEIMEKAGADRTITADNGKVFDLPNAEYYLTSNLQIEEVRDRVIAYAKSVDPKPAVFVTEGIRFSWLLTPLG